MCKMDYSKCVSVSPWDKAGRCWCWRLVAVGAPGLWPYAGARPDTTACAARPPSASQPWNDPPADPWTYKQDNYTLQFMLLDVSCFGCSTYKNILKSTWAFSLIIVISTTQSHPRTRMLVSKTDTTMSLSSRTSDRTLLTAASNSVVLFKSWKGGTTQRRLNNKLFHILTAKKKTELTIWKVLL